MNTQYKATTHKEFILWCIRNKNPNHFCYGYSLYFKDLFKKIHARLVHDTWKLLKLVVMGPKAVKEKTTWYSDPEQFIKYFFILIAIVGYVIITL